MVLSDTRGRPVYYVRMKGGDYEGNIALIPTILSTIISKGNLNIEREDFMKWVYKKYPAMSMVIILDSSSSVKMFLKPISKVLRSIYGVAKIMKDRIGLVVMRDKHAETVLHPTSNLNLLIRHIENVEIKGRTPLAQSLAKAFNILKQEREKNKGSNSMIMLISDCFPEPLEFSPEEPFKDPAYISVIKISKILRRYRIPVIVLNPYHYESREGVLAPGTKLAMMIAQLTGGKYIKISRDNISKVKDALFETLLYSSGGKREMMLKFMGMGQMSVV